MPRVRRKCAGCGRDFWAKPKKVGDNLWQTATKCQRCKNRERQAKHIMKRKKFRIRIVEQKVNVKREVARLIWLENRHPELVNRIRSKKIKMSREEASKYNPIDDNNERSKKAKAKGRAV